MKKIITFLLVEDDPNDVLLVERQFKKAPSDIQLKSVNNGVEAIEYLEGKGKYADRQSCPLPDVILLDLNMPKLNGFDFLKWLYSSSPDDLLIPVIIMSSSKIQEDITRAYTLGVNSYIVKPVDWQEFEERIKALGVYWEELAQTPPVKKDEK